MKNEIENKMKLKKIQHNKNSRLTRDSSNLRIMGMQLTSSLCKCCHDTRRCSFFSMTHKVLSHKIPEIVIVNKTLVLIIV